MKKLMTMIAAVATAFGLYAADTGTSFECVDASGGPLVLADNITGSNKITELATGDFWNLNDLTNELLITQFVAGEEPTDFPDQYEDLEGGNNYLALKTGSAALTRYALAKDEGDVTTYDVGKNGTYFFDSNVKMTGFDEKPDIGTGAKLAVWLSAIDADATTTPATPGETNLYVSVDGGVTAVNCGPRPDLLDAWARVTIKAMPVTEDKETMGFVVFVKRAAVGNKSSIVYPDDVTLTPEAQYYADNGQLFLCADGTEIEGVSFKGQGAVDNLVFTQTAPGFVDDFYTVTWDDNEIASVTVGSVDVVKGAARVVTGNAETFDYIAADGYISSSTNITGEASKSYTIKAAKLAATAKIDGVPQTFSDLASAINAINGAQTSAELTLGADAGKITIENGNGADILIDLKGNDCGDIYLQDGLVTLTNSADGVSAVASLTAQNDGKLTVTEAPIKVDGEVLGSKGVLFLNGGKYLASVNEAANLNKYAPAGSQFVSDGQDPAYFVLQAVQKGTVIFICEKPAYEKEVPGNVGDPITAPTDFPSCFTMESWTNGEGVAVGDCTLVDGMTFSPKNLDIALTKSNNDYQIGSVADLQTLQAVVSNGFDCAGLSFKQTANIQMTGVWTGIGVWIDDNKDTADVNETVHYPFSGTYDGDNKTITGLTLASTAEYEALFNVVDGATLKNMDVTLAGFDTANAEAGASYGGAAVAGRAKATAFVNVTARGNIAGHVSDGNQGPTHNLAGIACNLENDNVFTDCTNEMDIAAQHGKAGAMAAIVGNDNGIGRTNTFIRCVNNGDISVGNDGEGGVGSLVGYASGDNQRMNAIVIEDCVNTGKLSKSSTQYPNQFGSFVGKCAQKYTITATGTNKAGADIPAVGASNLDKATITGLAYATVEGTVATFVADDALEAGNTYKTMLANLTPTFEFTEAGTIAFNTNVCAVKSFAITPKAESGLEVKETEDGGIVTFTATALPPPGPTPDPEKKDCDITKEQDGSYTVTPKEGSTTVTITGAQDGDVFNVAAVADVKITVNAGTVNAIVGGCNINDFIKGGEPIDTALDDAKVKAVVDDKTAMAFTAGESKSLTVKAIPGLTYLLMEGDDVAAALANQAATHTCTAGETTVTLTDTTDRGAKAFYTIKVTKSAE